MRYPTVFLFLTLLFGTSFSSDLTLDLTDRIDIPLNSSDVASRSLPAMPGAYADSREGYPALPMLPFSLRIPVGMEAAGVTWTAEWETAAEDVSIPPLSAPAPLSLQNTPPPLAAAVYSSDEYWPVRPVSLEGNGFDSGAPAAQLLVSPLRWNPVSEELQRMTRLSVTLELRETAGRPLPAAYRGEGEKMLIVTGTDMIPAFQLLAQRRTDQGILTEVVSMDTVYAQASGRDQAEQLRNFVKDYRLANGLDYLLLGGDIDVVPFRKAYAMTCQAGIHAREDSLPCDLYFADLDGDWDANGNGIFGEISDNVDLYSDIFVGRAPVNSVTDAETFVANIAAYEDCYQDDHYQDVLFLAAILWTNPYTNSAESKDYIDSAFLPDFLNITKLYESLGNENLANTMAALNAGQNFINHDGHAWYSSIGVGDDYMVASDVDAVDSEGRFAASMYSIGCWSAAFDFDSMGEHFVLNPNGCTVGYIGNSSYGWGSPGNPCYGYSDALDHVYHDYLYSHRDLTAGELLAKTKEFFIPFSQWENVYRWHQYDVNLLGDPSLRAYRKTPETLNVQCPDIVTASTTLFPVYVPFSFPEELTVCVRDQGSNWETVQLDGSGYHTFSLTPPIDGDVRVCVTGAGAARTVLDIPSCSGVFPVVAGMTIDDDQGYGTLSPGCSADLLMDVLNQGTQSADSVCIQIDSISGPGTLVQDWSYFGTLAAGDQAAGSPPISLTVDAQAICGQSVKLFGTIQSAAESWELVLPILVKTPGLYFSTYTIDDTASGNGNGIPEPGETFDMKITLANDGLMEAQNVSLLMTGSPGYLSWPVDSAFTSSIPLEGTGDLTVRGSLDPSAPDPAFPWLIMDISSETAGYTGQDSLMLTVGETGISNDVESGASGWTHSGTGDLWEITDSQSHSSSHSWHCGNSEGYVPGMDCSLVSPFMILAPQAQLSFWATFDVAIYGTDGLYVIITDEGGEAVDTLDYIGSGGALGGGLRGTGTGWAQWHYSLDQWSAGNGVKLQFTFISDDDSDTGMGFYIDDITVQGGYVGSTGITTRPPVVPLMGLPQPNPAAETFSVPLNIPSEGRWELSVYDISGRCVMENSGQAPVSRLLEMNVSGLAPGVYFLRLSGTETASGRLVVIR